MSARTKIIIVNEKDNVATALEMLRAGTEISADVQGRVERIIILSDIPMGHKLALRDIDKGESVIKYGAPIGQSTSKISRGEYVHVHNVISRVLGQRSR